MSRPHLSKDSITFFSASSPNFLFGSPLDSKVGGTRTAFEVFSFSVKYSFTENPEESLGSVTAGLWTDNAMLLIKRQLGFFFLRYERKGNFTDQYISNNPILMDGIKIRGTFRCRLKGLFGVFSGGMISKLTRAHVLKREEKGLST